MKLFIVGLLLVCVYSKTSSLEYSACDKENTCFVCQRTVYEMKFSHRSSCENTHCRTTCLKVLEQWNQPGSVFKAFQDDNVGKCDACFRAGFCSNAQCTEQKRQEQIIVEQTIDRANFASLVNTDKIDEMVRKITSNNNVNFKAYKKTIDKDLKKALEKKEFQKNKEHFTKTLSTVANVNKEAMEEEKKLSDAKHIAKSRRTHEKLNDKLKASKKIKSLTIKLHNAADPHEKQKINKKIKELKQKSHPKAINSTTSCNQTKKIVVKHIKEVKKSHKTLKKLVKNGHGSQNLNVKNVIKKASKKANKAHKDISAIKNNHEHKEEDSKIIEQDKISLDNKIKELKVILEKTRNKVGKEKEELIKKSRDLVSETRALARKVYKKLPNLPSLNKNKRDIAKNVKKLKVIAKKVHRQEKTSKKDIKDSIKSTKRIHKALKDTKANCNENGKAQHIDKHLKKVDKALTKGNSHKASEHTKKVEEAHKEIVVHRHSDPLPKKDDKKTNKEAKALREANKEAKQAFKKEEKKAAAAKQIKKEEKKVAVKEAKKVTKEVKETHSEVENPLDNVKDIRKLSKATNKSPLQDKIIKIPPGDLLNKQAVLKDEINRAITQSHNDPHKAERVIKELKIEEGLQKKELNNKVEKIKAILEAIKVSTNKQQKDQLIDKLKAQVNLVKQAKANRPLIHKELHTLDNVYHNIIKGAHDIKPHSIQHDPVIKHNKTAVEATTKHSKDLHKDLQKHVTNVRKTLHKVKSAKTPEEKKRMIKKLDKDMNQVKKLKKVIKEKHSRASTSIVKNGEHHEHEIANAKHEVHQVLAVPKKTVKKVEKVIKKITKVAKADKNPSAQKKEKIHSITSSLIKFVSMNSGKVLSAIDKVKALKAKLEANLKLDKDHSTSKSLKTLQELLNKLFKGKNSLENTLKVIAHFKEKINKF